MAAAARAWTERLETRSLFSATLTAGEWQITGQDGDDVVVVEAVPGNASLLQAVVNGQVEGTVTAAGVTTLRVDAGAGNDRVTLRLDAASVSSELGASATAIVVRGGDGNDRLLGSSLAETFFGGAGNDRIDGGAGNDVLNGDDGNDNLSGGDGDDQLFGGAGNDNLAGGWDDDLIDGSIGKDRLSGGHNDDTLTGDKGPDRLFGGKGVDALDGGKGIDRIYAERGVDSVGPAGSTGSPSVGRDRLAVDDTEESTLRQTSDAELKQWLIDAAVKQWSWAFGKPADPWIYYWGRGGEVAIRSANLSGGEGVPVPLPVSPAAPPTAPGSPTNTGTDTAGGGSSTNTQVAGVDEADLVETDGQYLYALQRDRLVIADATPAASMSVVHSAEIDGSPIGLYLVGDRLTVISGSLSYWAYPPVNNTDVGIGASLIPPMIVEDPYVQVTVLDVSNRSSPTVIETTKLDGSYGESRMIGDRLYVVVRNDAWIPEPRKIPNPIPPPDGEVPPEGDPGDAIGTKMVAPIWPGGGYSDTIYESEADYRARLEGMSLQDLLPDYETTAGGQTSDGALVTTPNAYVRDLNDEDFGQNLTTVALLDVGDAAGGPVATSTVAGYGGTVYATSDALYLAGNAWTEEGDQTRLFKFGLEADTVSLQATGTVEGSVLNQFGMDEYADTFRIATNDWSGGDGATNHLFVLEQVGDQLETVGSIRNIAKGERLQSARFDGPRAYLVTFLQVDPLFTIDLSNARTPKIAGELKIPGFSSYLQPIGDGLLLGIGRDIDADGTEDNGLQLSLFDVSNLASPTRIAKYTVPDSYSEAESGHHAFSYFSDEKILAVPVGTFGDTRYTLSLAVLEVDPVGKAFRPLGEVTPPNGVRRSLRIGDVLFAVGDSHIQAVELQNPDVIIKTLGTV